MIENADRHELTYEDKEIILLGTAHVSRDSAELVERVIAEEKPDTVCVELCQSRYQAITQKDKWQETDLIKVIKEKKAFMLLSNLISLPFKRPSVKSWVSNPVRRCCGLSNLLKALGRISTWLTGR